MCFLVKIVSLLLFCNSNSKMHDVTEKNVKYFKCKLLSYRNIKYKTFYQS